MIHFSLSFIIIFFYIFEYTILSNGITPHDLTRSKHKSEESTLFVLNNFNVSRANHETLHRFFDTSAVSPNGKYVAMIELPRRSKDRENLDIIANITILDLQNKIHRVIDTTMAWGSQVGSHLQWGKNSKDIFYNVMEPMNSECRTDYTLNDCPYVLHGVKYNIHSSTKTIYEYPIYYVSLDSRKSISPDLLAISNTQKGYGVDWRHLKISKPTIENSLYVNDLENNIASIIYSLAEIANSISLNIDPLKKIYPFHTKWSFDGKYLLFVMRSIHQGISSTPWVNPPKVRVQHLFILSSEKKFIFYVFSWASKPFLYEGRTITLLDGNHPNWMANTLKISMNFQVNNSSVHNLARQSTISKKKTTSFSTVIINTEDFIREFEMNSRSLPSFPLFHQSFQFSFDLIQFSGTETCISRTNLSQLVRSQWNTVIASTRNLVPMLIVWLDGTGHPSFDSSGRFLLTDRYAKEVSEDNMKGQKKYSPITIVDINCQIEYPIAKALVETPQPISVLKHLYKKWINRKEDRSWRCDAHPAWSFDDRMVVYNSLNEDTGNREVRVITLNPQQFPTIPK